MLHTLATTLLAATPTAASPFPNDVLLDLLPREAPILITLGDLSALATASSDERGSWANFFADERVAALFNAAMEDEGEVEDIDAVWVLQSFMSTIEGGAVAIPELDEEPEAVFGILRLTDGYVDTWNDVLGMTEESLVRSVVAGHDAWVLSDAPVESIVLIDVGDLTAFGVGGLEAVEVELEGLLATLEDGPQAPGWWSRIPSRADGAVVELFADFAAIAEVDPEVEDAADWIEGGYVGIGIGDGDAGDAVLGLALQERDELAAFAGAFGEADTGLLARAPEGATTAAVMNLDVLALIEAVVETVDALEPGLDAQAQFEDGMVAASEVIGIDVESELLGNLTGDMVMVQWIDSVATMMDVDRMDEDDPELAPLLTEMFPVFALGIEDPEPFYDLLDTVVGFMGGMGAELEDTDHGSTLTIDDGTGFSMVFGISDDWLTIGADPMRVEAFLASEGGAFDEEAIDTITAASSGSMISVAETAVMLPMIEELLTMDDLSDVPPEMFDVLDAFAEHVGGVVLTDFEFTADWAQIRWLTR